MGCLHWCKPCRQYCGIILLSLFYPAIAQAQWQEDAIMLPTTESSYPQLPLLYQPIPPEYIQLGKQLEAAKARWQSSQLTHTALTSTSSSQKENTTVVDAFPEKIQHKINAYYHFLELREFFLAELEAKAIYQLIETKYLTEIPKIDPEIRAIWLDRGAIVAAKDEAGLAQLFDRFATAGINVVFMETVNASYPIYPSQVAPAQNPLLTGWDPLASGIKLAHARQMELHAWTWIFAAANQQHNILLDQPVDYLGPVLTAHPDWAAGDRQGNPFERGRKAFFDPANPAVRQYLLDLLTEIATKYDVDGIQLDYIRYPFQEPSRGVVYGFGDAARLQFRQQGYPDPVSIAVGDRYWKTWQDFRVAQVDQFVAQVATTLRQKRPDLILSAAVFAIPRDRRLEQIQQNWEAWIAAGHLDLLVPMTYADDAPHLATLTADLLATFPNSGTLLVPSVRLLNLDGGQALDQLQLLRQLPTTGTALFAASDLTPDFAATLGNNHYATDALLLPHQSPLAAIAQRFNTLEREWAVVFPEQPWRDAADKLNQSLTLAQAEPTLKNLLLVATQWQTFILTIQPYLNAYQKDHPYQVQVWQHRLTAIEQLLNYGDRRLSLLP